MRILSLDYEPLFAAEDDAMSTFASDTSAFDFDIVIWDPEASFDHYNHYSDTYMGLPSLSDTQSSSLKADVTRRRAEFKEFLEAGKTLVMIARPPQSCYVTTGDVQYSGTGRNARRTTMVSAFDILSALPIDSPGFQRASGSRIEAVGDNLIAAHLRKYASNLAYSATMATPPGTVVARVAGTQRSVASYMRVKNGGLFVIIPNTTFVPKVSGGNDMWPTAATEYQSGLLEAIENTTGSAEVLRPRWASEYSTVREQETREAVARQQAVIESSRRKLVTLQADAEAVEIKDQLYLGTGRQLELRVRDVLLQLGGTVTEPTAGRDDWRVEFDGKPAVVEVKGVAKSAAEKHAAQLEKWVSGSFEDTGVIPKGILVANTWRDTPLDDRNEDDFPAQMIPYSSGRNHCLLTGLDLFVISLEIEANPSRAKYWREKIMSTAGRLSDVPDWRAHINHATKNLKKEDKRAVP